MKLTIEKPKEEDKTIRLELEQRDGLVMLIAVEEDGEEWSLIRFRNDGSTMSMPNVPERLGFKVDISDGCLIIR